MVTYNYKLYTIPPLMEMHIDTLGTWISPEAAELLPFC